MDPITILTALSSIVPSIARWIGGKKAGDVAEKASKIITSITGERDPEKAIQVLKASREYQLQFQQAWQHFELGLQEELTKRHEADMKSDSWLSKNVRPLCLLFLVFSIVLAIFYPNVPKEKFNILCELGKYVFGYYFVGRSLFDKETVKFHYKKGE